MDPIPYIDPRRLARFIAIKRVVDVVKGTIILLILSPVLLLAALAIRLSGPGPILFSQTRGGWKGRPFRLYKFRTMRAGRTPDPKELVPLDHPEITRLGRFLRRTKIDELPQIFNVLRGDMSLIGPRPTLLDQIEAYDEFQRKRLEVRPGCTGLAQLHGGASIAWKERIRYDVYYVARCNLLLDLKVVLLTPWHILVGEGRTARPFAESRYARRMREMCGQSR
jgi:lipopolysaccharide/colanic/teichoic acid biosynthesis glycosyltransferase